MTHRFFSVVCFLLLAVPASAQWVQTNGPFNQYIPSDGIVSCFATIGNDIFASTDGLGIAVSSDGGSTWKTLPNSPLTVQTMTASGDTLVAGKGNIAYISTNSGAEWSADTVPFYASNLFYITAIAISGPNIVVGAGFGTYTYVSTNGGNSWIVPDSIRKGVTALAVLGGKLFAGVEGSIYASTDNGLHWAITDSGDVGYTIGFAESAGMIFVETNAALFRLSDTGFVRDTFGGPFTLLTALATIGSTIFVGTDYNGLYVSTDSGTDWFIDSSLMKAVKTYGSVSALLGWNGTLFAGTATPTVSRSTDNGSDWSVEPISPLTIRSHINRMDTLGNFLFALTQAGLYATTDSGAHWTADTNGMGYVSVTALVEMGGNLYAGTANNSLFVSSNGGESWAALYNDTFPYPNPGLTILSLRGSNGSLYAITPYGLYISTNTGSNWEDPLYVGASSGQDRFVILGSTLFLADTNGLYYSTDSGRDWFADRNVPTSAGVQTFAAIGTILLAGTSGGGLWHTSDDGKHWIESTAGLADSNITSILVSDTDCYAATQHGAVFVSSDSGQTWSRVTMEIPYLDSAVSLAMKNGDLYVGTTDSGIWRYSFPAKIDSTKLSVELSPAAQTPGMQTPEAQNLEAFPNPSPDFVHVNLREEDGGSITHIYTAVGQEIHAPVTFHGGLLTIDARELLLGSYFMRIEGASGNSYVVRFSRNP